MTHEPLRRMNPTDDDLTRASSVWTASRLMLGLGAAGVGFPHHRTVNDAAARSCGRPDLAGLSTGGLRGLHVRAANGHGAPDKRPGLDRVLDRRQRDAGRDRADGPRRAARQLQRGIPLSQQLEAAECRLAE